MCGEQRVEWALLLDTAESENERFENDRFENERFENERFENERFENDRFENDRFENDRFESNTDSTVSCWYSAKSTATAILVLERYHSAPKGP